VTARRPTNTGPSKASDRYQSESPLSAAWRPAVWERAILVGLAPGGDEAVLDELNGLARAAGAESVGRLVQARTTPDPATFVGRGKVTEIHGMAHSASADVVIFDDELSPGQLRNLEERLGVKVLDRTALILDIFALHARSGEGKAQVELAQLNYLLPRLRGWGEAMSRLGGGIGTRGPGETKIETDRQHIRRRITKLRRDIARLGKTRRVRRGGRERSGVLQVALAGYTNAGKSTLLNALTGSDVLVADQPFATLDPTTRRLTLPGGRSATLSDTVGFVRHLPHELVEAFKSTLEEVGRADLILHVADASATDVTEQTVAVREVLGEIGAADVPEILALNKWDRLDEASQARIRRRFPDGVPLSALTGEGLDELRTRIAAAMARGTTTATLLIPFARSDVLARLHREADILAAEDLPEGTRVRAQLDERLRRELDDLIESEQRRAWA
jgi:GTP-binding protein HflX